LIVHATMVALYAGGAWRGVLLTGGSGAGKSDLALRLLAEGWRLVADDRTLVWPSGGALWGRSPESISGLIEARGLGIMAAPALRFARVETLAQLDSDPAERLPETETETLQGIVIRRLRLRPFEASAPAKLGLAARGLFAGLGDEA
jgi:serine kinase of HPr protein (carbohydrate metabolism regulator)